MRKRYACSALSDKNSNRCTRLNPFKSWLGAILRYCDTRVALSIFSDSHIYLIPKNKIKCKTQNAVRHPLPHSFSQSFLYSHCIQVLINIIQHPLPSVLLNNCTTSIIFSPSSKSFTVTSFSLYIELQLKTCSVVSNSSQQRGQHPLPPKLLLIQFDLLSLMISASLASSLKTNMR